MHNNKKNKRTFQIINGINKGFRKSSEFVNEEDFYNKDLDNSNCFEGFTEEEIEAVKLRLFKGIVFHKASETSIKDNISILYQRWSHLSSK